VSNSEAYAKEYVPLANKAIADSGQKRLVSGGKTVSLAGAPPASRIVVSMFENLEKAKAAYSSQAYLGPERSAINTASYAFLRLKASRNSNR